jgi:hypothetical protein
MRQNMFINEINQTEFLDNFKIIDRVSQKEFRVIINGIARIMNYREIIDKYWDCLSFCDKEYIINLND